MKHVSSQTKAARVPPTSYEVLNIPPDASDATIRAAYRRMAMLFHPDRNPRDRRLSELRFKLISEAYAKISTPQKRAQYNRDLKRHVRRYNYWVDRAAHNDNTTSQAVAGYRQPRTSLSGRPLLQFLSILSTLFWPFRHNNRIH